VFDRVGRQFVDQEPERHGAVGVDFERLGLDIDEDLGRFPEQAG
jgi:hypothetical protein